MEYKTLTRRAVLRGFGASLTLPFMPSLAWALDGSDRAPKPPVRFALLLFGNGVWAPDWWAKEGEDGLELSYSLEPLKPFRDRVVALDGLTIYPGAAGVHYPTFTNFLSGKRLGPAGAVPDVALSFDQWLAQKLSSETPVSSMVISTQPPGGGAPYKHCMSWKNATTPVIPEFSPRRMWDRLFEVDVAALRRDRSVLDANRDQAKYLSTKLSYQDRQRMDAYMDGIRELEQRMVRLETDERVGWVPKIRKPDRDAPPEALPEIGERIKLLLDMVSLAYRMDRSRIAVHVLTPDGISGTKFGFIGDDVLDEEYHSISHHAKQEKKVHTYKRVNRYMVEQCSNFLADLDSWDEGNGTLLDNSIVLIGSNIRDGNSHDASNVPLVMAGGGGGQIRGNRALSFNSDDDRLMCNLYLSIAQAIGIQAESFGNSTRPLPGLL